MTKYVMKLFNCVVLVQRKAVFFFN